jgi:hypothetical protein
MRLACSIVAAPRHFLRRLRRHDEVELRLVRIVPAVGIVRLERGGVARLRGVIARQHQPVRGRMHQLAVDGLGVVHALRFNIAVARRVRPDRLVLLEAGGDRSLLEAGESILVVGRLAADPDEAGRAPRIAPQRPGNGAVANHRVVELQLLLGEAQAREIVVDQDRNGLAQIGRRLALREQHILAVEVGKCEPIARQICRRHDAVGCQFGAEHRQVEAGIAAIGRGRPQHQGMRLLLRPVRHVARTDVAGEDFIARHFRGAVDTVFQRAVTAVPIRPRQQLLFEQRRKRSAAERREVHRDSSAHARAQHLPARRTKWDHACPLGHRSPSDAEIIRGGREDRSACEVIRNALSHHDDDAGSWAVQPARFQHTQRVSPSVGDPNAEAMSQTISLPPRHR